MENKPIELFSPRYDGKRFEEHRLPLDLIEDLTVLRQLTIDMAKHIYLEEHTDKQRVPRGFTKGISMELDHLEDGSTIPKILLIVSMSVSSAQANAGYFEQASEKIVELIQAADNEEILVGLAPRNILQRFKGLGKNLLENEFIEFRPEETDERAKYDRTSRERLIEASANVDEQPQEVLLRGSITALNKRNSTFEFQLINGRKLVADYNPENLGMLQDGLVKLEQNQKVAIKMMASYKDGSKQPNVKSIDEVVLLDEFDVPARLEELALLKGGWLNGESEGEPLDDKGVNRLSHFFQEHYSKALPLPATFPTPEGNIQFEWVLNNTNISVEVDLLKDIAEYHEYDKVSKETLEVTLDLKGEIGWEQLNSYISKRCVKL